MALKATITEQCQYCYGRNARRVGDKVTLETHKCEGGPPGPARAPHSYSITQVNFVPANFSAEFLRRELEDAWLAIEDLRAKRWKAEEAAVRAVKSAFGLTYTPAS